MEKCNDKSGARREGRRRKAEDKHSGGKLIWAGAEKEIEKERPTDRKRKGGYWVQASWVGGCWRRRRDGGRTISGKNCDSTDPMTGTSINKWRVCVCVGQLGIIPPGGEEKIWQTPCGQGQTQK